MTRPFRLTLLALLAAALLGPAPASAAPSQVTTFEAPSQLLDDFAREATLDEIQSLGVSHVRALVYWSQFSARPDSKRKPAFDTADPNAYPADTWGRLDHLVDSLARRGMTAQLTLTGPVPKWATKRRKDKVSDPSAELFGKWARAVAMRYGDRIHLWSIWNEPNHPQFLGPQFKDDKPHTPRLYRKLYVAGEDAIHQTPGNNRDKVLFGETAPVGTPNVVAPLAFLRGALCLNKDYKAKGSCKKLRIDGYAHHAYTPKAGPTHVSDEADEVSIGSLGRLSAALDKAARAGRIAKGRGIYLTEFGIQSWPDKLGGVRPARQAEYLAISERIAYANPRVKAFSQYLLRDDDKRKDGYSGFESGLRTAKGKKKPSYNGFMLPLVATRYGSSDVLWGRVRPATGLTQVVIERKVGNRRWKRLTALQTGGVYGFRTEHGSKQRYRAKWTRPDGTTVTGPSIRAY
jgi:hypothetical protein